MGYNASVRIVLISLNNPEPKDGQQLWQYPSNVWRTTIKNSPVIGLFLALSLAMIPFVSNLLLLLIPVMIFGIAHGISSPSVQVFLAGLASTEYHTAFISLNGMFLRLGRTFGPLLMGLIYSIWEIGAVFYAGAGFSIAVFTSSILMIK